MNYLFCIKLLVSQFRITEIDHLKFIDVTSLKLTFKVKLECEKCAYLLDI